MRRSPQDKKRLSYERDGRNTYGENDKASRKAIPRFKAASNREMRRKTRALLEADRLDGPEVPDAVDASLARVTFKGLHPVKRKKPDTPLGLLVTARPRLAEAAEGAPATARRRAAIAKQIARFRLFGLHCHDQGGRRNAE